MLYIPFEAHGEYPPDTAVRGKLYRVAGFAGRGMNFEDGSLVMPNLLPEDTFSVMFWVRTDRWLGHESCIAAAAGSSCSRVDMGRGMRIEVGGNYVRVCRMGPIGDMPFQIDMTCAADVAGKWTHVVFTQDAESRRFGISVNFAPMAFWGIPEGMDLTRDGRLYIGQDEENDDGKRLRGVLDDLCISRKAVRDDNLPWLQTYYEL